MEYKEIMTRREAAAYMGVSLTTFAKHQHEIAQIRIGKNVRFRRSAIDAYLDSLTQKGSK